MKHEIVREPKSFTTLEIIPEMYTLARNTEYILSEELTVKKISLRRAYIEQKMTRIQI